MGKTLPIGVLALALATTSSAFAQKIDLVSLGGQYMPSADMPTVPGKVQVASYDASANVPVPLAEKTFLVPGLGYHVDAVSFSEQPRDFIELTAFHSAEVALLFVQLLPNDWSLSFRVAPGLAGDFEDVDSGMLRLNALAMATHSFSKRFLLGAGGMTTFSFGSLLPLPALYFDWRPFDGFQVEGFVPAFLQARHTIANRVRFGVLADFNGNEYAVRDERIRSVWPCQSDATRAALPAECFDNLAYSVGTAGITTGVRIVSSLWVTGLFGHSFYRRFDQRNAEKDLVSGGGQDLPNSLVVRVGLLWRLPNVD